MGRRRQRPAGPGHPGRRRGGDRPAWPTTTGRTAASRPTTCSSWRRRCCETTPGPARSPQAADAWRADAVGADRGRLDHASRRSRTCSPRRPASAPSPQGIFDGLQGHFADRALGARVPGSGSGADARHPAGRRSRRRPDVLGAAGSRRPARTARSPTPAPNPWPAGLTLVGWLGGERPAVPARAAGVPRAAAGRGAAGAGPGRVGRRGGDRCPPSWPSGARRGLDHARPTAIRAVDRAWAIRTPCRSTARRLTR